MNNTLNKIKQYLADKPVIKHLGILFIFIVFILILIYVWLRFYTNHGQKIPMVNITGKSLTQASELIDDHSFQLVVTDSSFVIGKSGGIILDQNPKPGAEVKEGRKIYVTITKQEADKILVSELPLLYGNDFVQKSVELKHRGILAKIKSKKYDPGDPNHILEVYYKNQLIIDKTVIRNDVKISKGDELEFVVSDKDGGEISVPDLVCSSVSEIEFLLQQFNLEVGEITAKGAINDTSSAFVIDQDPKYDGITKIPMNSKINITVVSNKPSKCN